MTLFCEKRVSYQEKFYDLDGKCIETINFNNNTTHTVSCEYDEMGRILKQVENGKKITLYTYTKTGKVQTLTKPDNIVITHAYDDLDREIALLSSDGSIHYAFTYNLNDQIIESLDNRYETVTERSLDGKGRLIQETLANGLELNSSYDSQGRRKSLTLPDNSSVEYIYDALYLRLVQRNTKNGKRYQHQYVHYDLCENLIEEKFFNDLFTQTFSVDNLQRKKEVTCSYFSQEVIEFDACSKVIHLSTKTEILREEKAFDYDSLDHLTRESGLQSYTYTYDAMHNRIGKDGKELCINDLNQLVSTENAHYEYDPNGNPIYIEENGKEFTLTYDALDRLIEVTCVDQFSLIYSYDSFHRRVSSTLFILEENNWIEKKTSYYLYDGNQEIGKATPFHQIEELRVLGNNPRMELGASIALEINDEIYLPLHDLFSNIVIVIDAKSNSIVEAYNFSAFGQIEIILAQENLINPWRFCSKRTDPYTSFIFFGRRYYSPNTGRFLNCDPKSFSDCYNLYSYVLNNPLSNYDPDGLETIFGELLSDYTTLFWNEIKNPFDFTEGINFSCFNQTLNSFVEERESLRAVPRDLQRESYYYDLCNQELDCGRIGFINGINTSENESLSHANYISQFTGGKNVHTVYNRTRGTSLDIIESGLQLSFLLKTRAVTKTIEMWHDFFEHNQKDKFLHICHSQGAIITRNALLHLPSEYRNRLIIVAISPAAYISKNLCETVHHYASKNDLVPKIDILGRNNCRDTTTILEPHPGSIGQDHDFQSPTFREKIEEHISDYLNNR